MRKLKKLSRIMAVIVVFAITVSMFTTVSNACGGQSGTGCSAIQQQLMPQNWALRWQYCWRNSSNGYNGGPASIDTYAALELYYGDPTYDYVYPYARAELLPQTISLSKFRSYDPRNASYANTNAYLQVEIEGWLSTVDQNGRQSLIYNKVAKGNGWANFPTNTFEIKKTDAVIFETLITARNNSNSVVFQVAPAVWYTT